ncbi:MAG: hypothetical protein CM1200mP2_28750 [Planctomycetaceae bacterium]|nr:MAG: hypothetical protein CM1200mP2_28750 [Planctomycetaceae bacterium]
MGTTPRTILPSGPTTPVWGRFFQHLDIGPPRRASLRADAGFSWLRSVPFDVPVRTVGTSAVATIPCSQSVSRSGIARVTETTIRCWRPGAPLLPSLGELPAVTADRLDRRRSLLETQILHTLAWDRQDRFGRRDDQIPATGLWPADLTQDTRRLRSLQRAQDGPPTATATTCGATARWSPGNWSKRVRLS